MNPEWKAKWLTALRSGDYQQGKNQLLNQVPNDKNGYCCLGVLCEAVRKETGEGEWDDRGKFTYRQSHNWSSLPNTVQEAVGLNKADPKIMLEHGEVPISYLNDCMDYNFNQIADIIEKQL